MKDSNRIHIRSLVRQILKENGYLEDHMKPDVLGLFDEIQTQGQDFMFLIKTIRNESNNDKFIMSEVERICVECIKSGNIESFVDAINELKVSIEESY